MTTQQMTPACKALDHAICNMVQDLVVAETIEDFQSKDAWNKAAKLFMSQTQDQVDSLQKMIDTGDMPMTGPDEEASEDEIQEMLDEAQDILDHMNTFRSDMLK